MSYHLFLDDAREPKHVHWVKLPDNVAWVKARSYTDFVKAVQTLGVPKFIAYDCDLCQEHYEAFFTYRELYTVQYRKFQTKCGIHCLEFILKLCKHLGLKHPEYVIHTQNHFAREFMTKMITEFNTKEETVT